MTEAASIQDQFPVGFHLLHKDRSLNFQLNRWATYLGRSALEDMQAIAPRLRDYPSFSQEFLALGEKALREGRKLNAAYYLRSAEFFMRPEDPAKRATRQRFLELVWEHFGIGQGERLAIPYVSDGVTGLLPAYRFTPERPARSTIVVHGGFDSYIEEFIPLVHVIMNAGYDVICFEGPGQGGARIESGLHLTHEWHKPVKAVLDHFGLDRVTLIGISMGACLAMRAAAFEPRVERVVAYDVFYDWLETTLSKFDPSTRSLICLLLRLRAVRIFNTLFAGVMRRNLLIEWAMRQAIYIMGANSPYDVYRRSTAYTTRDISPLIRQDVLLMAGTDDHYVPLAHFYRQAEALTHVRSLTARLFTAEEQAQNHCQVGNIGLALEVIVNWMEQTE